MNDRLLNQASSPDATPDPGSKGRIVMIDDSTDILYALASLFRIEGYACETYTSAKTFLQEQEGRVRPAGPCCIVCDMKMPELDGLDLLQQLQARGDDTPVVFMSGASGAYEAVRAFRAGAMDFLIKPVDAGIFLNAVKKAMQESMDRQSKTVRREDYTTRIANLTRRERDVARLVAQGFLNREIADQLGIALCTVKLHRQRVMDKLEVESVAELVRLTDEGGL
jgi:FixJ family two-component response regulator